MRLRKHTKYYNLSLIHISYNESMWEVEFVGTRDDGSYTESRIGNVIGNLQENSAGTGAGYTYAFYAGSLILWDLFDAKDARRDLAMAPYKLSLIHISFG